MKEIAKRIRDLRDDKGMSQKGLAKLMGVSPSVTNSWEKGRTEPDIEMIKKLCKLFGCTAGYLIGIED